ncbi:MAG: hypothetical protein QOH25_2609 [Acidobacteriota bacterium]|nr:hypothetical protein [Acidobacteriota bacterium]
MKGKHKGSVARWMMLGLCLFMASCGGSLYKVKPKIDAPVAGGRDASAGGFSVRAVPLMADEESQELFEANLPLAGLLPVRVEISNESGAMLSFKRVRFNLRDGDGRVWKLRSPKQAVSRILTANEIYLYNPNSRKKFEQAVVEHGFDLALPLEAGKQRRGLLFFQTPKKEAVESPRGLVLTIEGLPQPIEVIFN